MVELPSNDSEAEYILNVLAEERSRSVENGSESEGECLPDTAWQNNPGSNLRE